jgi:hypothetical protein
MIRLRSLACYSALVGLSLLACSDDEDEMSDDQIEGTGPLYLIATSFEAGDQRETYFVTTDRFDEGTVIDPTDGPKVLDGVVPLIFGGALFVTDAGRPVIMRYDIGAGDRLEKTQELSFMSAGVTETFSWHVWIQSDTKAYLFDQASSQIVLWNPKTMELLGKTIDLSAGDREGFVQNLVLELAGPVPRGDELIIPLGWVDQDGNSRHASGALILDTKNDEVVALAEDDRCGESYATVTAPDGDIYFFPPDWSALPHYFADMHRPTCVLRMRAGENTFVEDESLDLSALGTGSAAAGAVPDLENGFFFTAVDEELWADGDGEGGEIWRFYHHDFATEESRVIESLPLWSTNGYYVKVDGKHYIPREEETDDGLHTTMYEVDGDSDPAPLFGFDASWYGAGRLR